MRTTSVPSRNTPLNATAKPTPSADPGPPGRRAGAPSADVGRGLGEDGVLVVLRLVPAGPQDGLAEPGQPEDQQQCADHHPEGVERDVVDERDPDRTHQRPGRSPPRRRPPGPNASPGWCRRPPRWSGPRPSRRCWPRRRPGQGRRSTKCSPPRPGSGPDDDHRAEDLAALHPGEGLLDVVQADRLGDEAVEIRACPAGRGRSGWGSPGWAGSRRTTRT